MSADSKAPPLQIRGLSTEAYDRFRRGAAARNMTQGAYLMALLALHSTLMGHQALGVESLRDVLSQLGLQPVTA